MIPRLKDAIVSLVGNTTAFEITDGAITNWDYSEVKTNIVQPTEAALATELARLQTAYDAQDYARKRKAEYDQLNQFEMQFDDKENSTTTWVDKINEIKGRHPK
jgi:hypothetical protein